MLGLLAECERTQVSHSFALLKQVRWWPEPVPGWDQESTPQDQEPRLPGLPYAQFPFFSFEALRSPTNHKNWRPARRFLLSVDQFRQGRYFEAARFQLREDRPEGGGRAQAAISDVVQDDDGPWTDFGEDVPLGEPG